MQKNTDHRIVLLDIMADGSLKMTINENYTGPSDHIEEICQEQPDECSALREILEMSGYNQNGYGYRHGYEVINPAALCLDPGTPIIGQFDLNDGHPQHVGEYERIFVYHPGTDEDGQMGSDFATVLLANGEVWFGSPTFPAPPEEPKDLTALAIDALILLERLHEQLPDAFSTADQNTMLLLSKALYDND